MIPFIPKELDGKITFIHHDVKVKDGISLNESEMKIFDKFRSGLLYSIEHKFD